MEPNNEMKNKVDQTANLEEAKDVIAKAGMLLTDDEVSEVAGGGVYDKLFKITRTDGRKNIND